MFYYNRFPFGGFFVTLNFAVTAIVDLFIRIPYKKQDTSGSVLQIVKGDLSESIRFVTKQKPFIGKSLIPIFLMVLLFGSMLMIDIPILVTAHLDMNMTFEELQWQL